MRMALGKRTGFVAAAFASLFLTACNSGDVIKFSGQADTGVLSPDAVAKSDAPIAEQVEEAGVLVDGRLQDPGEIIENDAGFVSPDSELKIINRISGNLNEIIAFSRYRRPEVVVPNWTSGRDTVPVAFKPRIVIPVTLWIVHGPFDASRDNALEAIGRTQLIWNAERVGLAIGDITINDATNDDQRNQVLTFPNGDQGDAIGWAPLRTLIGFDAGRVNIYWLDTVDGSPTAGWSNFGAQIAMSHNSNDELLVHEFGHAFSLHHIDADTANFNDTNIAHSASWVRGYFTEGQTMRVHMDPSSALNAVYTPVAPALPTRTCTHTQADDSCPALNRRIWSDGAFPDDNQ